MLTLHIYIKLNRLLHCSLTSASIHDYLFWFLCKMAYKHGAGILSACQWVCFQWQSMALIIVLMLRGTLLRTLASEATINMSLCKSRKPCRPLEYLLYVYGGRYCDEFSTTRCSSTHHELQLDAAYFQQLCNNAGIYNNLVSIIRVGVRRMASPLDIPLFGIP